MARYDTSQGHSVPHCHVPSFPCHDRNFTHDEIQIARDWVSNNFPNTVEVRAPSWKYNCHGYAYAHAHGWFDDPSLFIEDDFSEVPLSKAAKKGDVVIYMKDGKRTHSAIVKLVKNGRIKTLRSKWGTLGAVLHDLNDVPEAYGDPLRLLRRR
jgi:hypothetical protein